MRAAIFSVLALGLMAGCGAPPEEAPPVPEPLDLPLVGSTSCSDAAFAPLVGRTVSALNGVPTPEQVRIIAPGQIITTEYLPRRLNVEHNEDGIVLKAWCG